MLLRPRSLAAVVGAFVVALVVLQWLPAGERRATADTTGGFFSEAVVDEIPYPIAFQFTPDGRTFVASIRGSIYVIDSDGDVLPEPFITLPVNYNIERGLVGFVLDPDFDDNGFVYIYYTVENSPDEPFGPKTGRLIRVTADGNTALPGSEVVLLGSVVGDASSPSCEDFPPGTDCLPADGVTHVGGATWFGAGGYLYLATGDAALRPLGNVPELMQRSQDLDSLAGKVLRVDPADGSAPADNPFFTGDPSANRSKVWAYGLRQPFRAGTHPNSGQTFIGEVGSRFWEEINIVQPGANYGWPCYEGAAVNPDTSAFPVCEALYASGAPVAHPIHAYTRSPGAAIVGGGFYTGADYPPEYQDTYFFGDWVRGSIWALQAGAGGGWDEATVLDMLPDAGPLVDLQLGPDGNAYYLTWTGSETGELRRLTFVDGNRRPAAHIEAAPLAGPVPLTVHFEASASTDPDGGALTFLWDFGDGTTSTSVGPNHTYAEEGAFLVQLTATDDAGASDTAILSVLAGGIAPAAMIHEPDHRFAYQSALSLSFSGSATDGESAAIPPGQLAWEVVLHHCEPASAACHTHPYVNESGAGGSLITPDQGNEVYYLEVTLTATDAAGLSARDAIVIGADSDGDGLLDHEELLVFASDAADPDIDVNGVPDGADDWDGDTCTNAAELGKDERQGGRRDPTNPWDFFDPTGDGLVRVDDIAMVVRMFGIDAGDPGYTAATDRTRIGPLDWQLDAPDGRHRVADITAVVGQFNHNCA